MRITVDLAKASTEPVDLTGVLNPRVGDGDLKLPFHLMYNGDDEDMRGKSMDFLSEGSDKKKIYVSGTVDESTKGDDPYTGNVTFTFPTDTFKTPGAYDVDKTMFRVVNNDDHSVISTVNVKMNVLPNDSDVDSSDDVSYDSRMEKIMKDYSDKGQASLNDAKQKAQQIIDDANKQATDYLNGVKKQGDDLLDEIKQTNSEAKGNVAGDTAATATQAKQLANDNSGKIHDLQGEVGDARGRFMTLSDREDKQDFNIERKEDKSNANANYAAQNLRNDAQDKEIAKKANQSFITDYLSRMYLQPEGFANANDLKAKYPNGKPGIMVAADTGHKWIWANNKWNDAGVYQSAGIADNSVDSRQVDTISASKIVDNQLFLDGVVTWGKVTVDSNDNYAIITSNEVQTDANLVGAFIPLIITNKSSLVLTANVTSSLDTGYVQPIYIADADKKVIKQIGNIDVPNKDSAANAKETLEIDEEPGDYYLLIPSKAVGTVTYRNLTINASGSQSPTVADEISELNNKIEELPISASKIVDNHLITSKAEGQGEVTVVGKNDYVMITSIETQTAANLVGAFIPLIITNKSSLVLTANVTSSLDTGYVQPIYIADADKKVIKQIGNIDVPNKDSAANAKETLEIDEEPGDYYLLIPSKAVGTVTYRNLTINASGSQSPTVADEISELNNKIEELPSTTKRAFDTIINNNVQLDKVTATEGIELTRDVNTITAKVNKAHSAEETQAIFFPVHVQNRNAEFIGTVKVAPIKFSETYTQQIYLADAERNLGEPLGTFPVNSQTSADFKVNLPASQDFCIALIASVTGTFEFELTVNNSTGRNINLEEYTTWLDSGTYDHAHMDISRINYPSLTAKTIDGVEYVAPYHTFGVDNGKLRAIYVWTEKAGTYSFCVGKLDQNNLIVNGKYFDLTLAKGFNSIGVDVKTDAASNLFMKIMDGVNLYQGNQAIKVQTAGQHVDLGMYSGDYFQDNHGILPFGYDVVSLSPTDRIKTIEDQQRQNTASIAQLQGATILTASNGVKYKLMVANDGTLSTKNMTPKKVRVFGNSLTATPEGFGLAASDPQHDYYYLMSQYILRKNPSANIERHGTGSWEMSTTSADRQKAFDNSFKPYLDADTDLVIVQCMENVGSLAAKQTLSQDSATLLQNIKKASPHAQIIWMYGWWGDYTVFDPAQEACDRVGAKGINLNDIGTQKSMQSYAGQKRTLKDGAVREIKDIEASHPGDAGMKAIADRLIANFDF